MKFSSLDLIVAFPRLGLPHAAMAVAKRLVLPVDK